MLQSSGKPHVVPFLSVVSDSARAVSGGWGWVAVWAADDTEGFGGLYDWLPKFCLFSLASASSLSKAAIWHCSTVDTSNLQNWQQKETSSKGVTHKHCFEAMESAELSIDEDDSLEQIMEELKKLWHLYLYVLS